MRRQVVRQARRAAGYARLLLLAQLGQLAHERVNLLLLANHHPLSSSSRSSAKLALISSAVSRWLAMSSGVIALLDPKTQGVK